LDSREDEKKISKNLAVIISVTRVNLVEFVVEERTEYISMPLQCGAPLMYLEIKYG